MERECIEENYCDHEEIYEYYKCHRSFDYRGKFCIGGVFNNIKISKYWSKMNIFDKNKNSAKNAIIKY